MLTVYDMASKGKEEQNIRFHCGMKITVFWHVVLYSLDKVRRRFGVLPQIFRHLIQSPNDGGIKFLWNNNKVQIIWRYNPEDSHIFIGINLLPLAWLVRGKLLETSVWKPGLQTKILSRKSKYKPQPKCSMSQVVQTVSKAATTVGVIDIP